MQAEPQTIQPAETTIFTDAKGRQWDTRLTLAGAKRIDKSDFTALGIPEDFTILKPSREFFTTILTDTSVTFALIWAVIHPQAKGMEGFPEDTASEEAQEEFQDGLNGEAIEAGRDAFWRAISDFFPRHKTALSILLQKYDKARERIQMGIANMDQKIGAVLDAEVDRELANLEKRLDNAAN